VSESKDVESDWIPKIATGFCGGVSHTGGTCGAVSGGIMAVSLFNGRNNPEESATDAYKAVQKMIETFKGKFGSTNCKELTGCDLGKKEGQETYISEGLRDKCRHYTEEATKIAIEVIDDEEE
jgi:C_GCAxxG_C_C family probable redox protein